MTTSPPDDEGAALPYRYAVYGVTIDSDAPLPLPHDGCGLLGRVACRTAAASIFLDATRHAAFQEPPESWERYAAVPDGSTYLRWRGVGEFLVSKDGGEVVGRRFDGSSFESYHVYMLGQALSFAFVKQGIEPLHATAVVGDGGAIALLGGSGYGKSTLAAAFLRAGGSLLTDDLLVAHESSDTILAYPGPARIKLFPKVASRVLGDASGAVPMNNSTNKVIATVVDGRRAAAPVPLRAIYRLASPQDACRAPAIAIAGITAAERVVTLLQSTFNRRLVTPPRLARLLETMTVVARCVPVKALSYPRDMRQLADVRARILEDAAGSGSFERGA